ncbi:MAG: aminotransferase class V-fold PLP-dependent enzyme [Tissierellia bacterium]|nr:aminotransferase class V-fold PLP-dependent enzyme [Tissierellia bacterium]
MRMFFSDNNSGAHPKILEAVINCNKGDEPSYGEDKYTKRAIDLLKELFQKDVDVYFVTTGTSANILGVSGLLKAFEGVICPDTAHINIDECGALERFGGAKIIYVPNREGKLKIEDVKEYIDKALGDVHQVQPRVISISQITELGTAYTVDEIKELADFAHENNMLLHIDGARIANAVVAFDSSFKEMITDTGVDLLSFGGTKNGMMMGEAIISFNRELSKNFNYIRKQGMQLVSKMRFISAQFIPYIEEEIWRENAVNSNNMAQYLKDQLAKLPGVEFPYVNVGNMLFVQIPRKWNQLLEKRYPVYVTDYETNTIRLVTSFDTTKEEVDTFIDYIKWVNENI